MEFFEKIVLFFSLFSVGFCCNSGWHLFEGFCYQVSQHLYDVQLAGRYCVLAGGQLAQVRKSETLKFLNTLPNFDGTQEYWLDENSSIIDFATTTSSTSDVTQTVAPNNCPYAKVQTINLEFCTEKKYFICQVKEEESMNVCPTGFDKQGPRCYRAILNEGKYEDAKKSCALQKSQLAVLDNEDKEFEAKALIIGKNKTFMLGATKTGDVFKWSNGNIFQQEFKTFETEVNDTSNSSDTVIVKKCVGLLSEADRPTIFSWVRLDCEEKSNYLCQADAQVLTTTEKPTTAPPLSCPHGVNWKSHESSGYCYWETTYETERVNWYQAREFCQSYGGDLASYEDEQQEDSGLGGARGHYRGLWIGLKRDEQTHVFYWVDGTPMSYTNWNSDQPNQTSKSKFCVTHASGTSKWELDYCGVKRWFICKAPKVTIPVAPDLPPTKKKPCDFKGVSAYRNQWYMYEDHCYLVHEQQKYSWDTAQLFCQDNDGHLASLHTFNETNFVLSLMSNFPESNFWIGLSALDLHSPYVWSDNSPIDFVYWSDNRTAAEGLSTCIAMDKKDGSWNNYHCNRLQYVVCKRGINASYDFTTVAPATNMTGSCENEWYNYGNKCYKSFGIPLSRRLKWSAAKDACKDIGAALVSIHSQDEQDLLTDLVLEAGGDVWIGLHSKDSGVIFNWDDDSRMDFTYWNDNEPGIVNDPDLFVSDKPNNLCVEMEYVESNMGKWNDIACSASKAYICEKMKDPNRTEPYEDPFLCPNISGWYKLGKGCYGFFDQKLPWLKAQGECRKYGADLITFKNSAVAIFVKRKLKGKDGHYWIGARETSPNKYESLSGQPLFYTYWESGQPHAASIPLDNCVATGADNGWIVKSCKESNSFICRLSRDIEPESEIGKLGSCEGIAGDWYDSGGDYCYMYKTSLSVTWTDAMYFCYKHGGFLASFHDLKDINELMKLAAYDHKSSSMHIGLGKRHDGNFAWVDDSPLDFTNWGDGEPDHVYNHCVEMSLNTGKWKVIDCDDIYRGFICSYKKKIIPDDPVQSPLNSTVENDIISQKLPVGGIFGIVICVLVILAVAGMTAYYFLSTKEIKPNILDPEPLL